MSEDSQRLDRLEEHFKFYKRDVSEIKDSVKEIKILLGGSALNGNKGFVRLMELNEDKIRFLETELMNVKNDIDGAKFWGKGLAGVIFVTIGIAFKKLFNL
jgi:hypothetical protein